MQTLFLFMHNSMVNFLCFDNCLSHYPVIFHKISVHVLPVVYIYPSRIQQRQYLRSHHKGLVLNRSFTSFFYRYKMSADRQKGHIYHLADGCYTLPSSSLQLPKPNDTWPFSWRKYPKSQAAFHSAVCQDITIPWYLLHVELEIMLKEVKKELTKPPF